VVAAVSSEEVTPRTVETCDSGEHGAGEGSGVSGGGGREGGFGACTAEHSQTGGRGVAPRSPAAEAPQGLPGRAGIGEGLQGRWRVWRRWTVRVDQRGHALAEAPGRSGVWSGEHGEAP
jgi:hypothetical protein